MEPNETGPTELHAIKGGRRSFSVGGFTGTAVGWGLMVLGLLALGCAILGGVWCFEQLWGAVT